MTRTISSLSSTYFSASSDVDGLSETPARQPQEPPEQEGEQVIEGNATERNEQVAPVFRQHFARQPRGQAVNAHTGNGDGHNESAEKGLGVRTDPTSDRADIASGSQQQDDLQARESPHYHIIFILCPFECAVKKKGYIKV